MLGERRQAIPSEADWGETAGDFDATDAKETFLGRSNAEMRREFKKQFMRCSGDMYWMPRAPFHYYMIGFTEFLISEDYEFDDDGVFVSAVYMNVVERRLSEDVLAIVPIADVVINGAEFIKRNVDNFEWNTELDGSADEVNNRIDHIIDRIRHLQNENTDD